MNTARATVTYHIITLPFDNPQTADIEAYRIEALRYTSDAATVTAVPAALTSPMATNFRY